MRVDGLVFGALVALQVGAVLRAYLVQRRQKAQQDQLADTQAGKRFWRIVVARPEHLARFWKLDAVQGRGLLIDDGAALRLAGRWGTSGDSFDIALPRDAGLVRWRGDPSPGVGNRSWAALRTPEGEVMFAVDTQATVAASREALADLFRAVWPGLTLTAEQTVDFALEKNPRSITAVAVFFALALFAVIDTWVVTRFELTDAQIAQLLTNGWTALLAGFLLWSFAWRVRHWLAAGRVPARESLVLAIMLTAALAGATLPALKRIDQALAATSSQDHAYRVIDTAVRLLPVDTRLGLPPLRFSKAPEYWAQFPVGSTVAIPLLRGPLGLWQLDHARMDPPVLAFYDKLEAAQRPRAKP